MIIELPWLDLTWIISIIFIIALINYYVWQPSNWIEGYKNDKERAMNLNSVGFSHLDSELRKRKVKTKAELVREVQRRRNLGDRPPLLPNGWFAILESFDLKADQVKHVQALGENFAVIRSSKGEVHVLDTYCPHLGANMAVGGVVKGDCLECPFHGWQFRGEDGICSHIPSYDKVPKSAAVKKWTSNEANGFVFVWYHAEGEPPSWQVKSIPEIETGKLRYCGRTEHIAATNIQEMVENAADLNHFDGIHAPSVLAGSDIRNYKRFIHSFLTHSWNTVYRAPSAPGETHMAVLTFDHSFTLLNKYKFLKNNATITHVGPGFIVTAIKQLSQYVMVSSTPVDDLHIRVVGHVYSPPHLFMVAKLILYVEKITDLRSRLFIYGSSKKPITITRVYRKKEKNFMASSAPFPRKSEKTPFSSVNHGQAEIEIERDIYVWNHKKYLSKPILARKDENILKFRRWFSQFYSENSPRRLSKETFVDW